MKYKIVDDWRTKGIILTAESLLQLRQEIQEMFSGERYNGAMCVYELLEDSYNKAHNKR